MSMPSAVSRLDRSILTHNYPKQVSRKVSKNKHHQPSYGLNSFYTLAYLPCGGLALQMYPSCLRVASDIVNSHKYLLLHHDVSHCVAEIIDDHEYCTPREVDSGQNKCLLLQEQESSACIENEESPVENARYTLRVP